MEQPPPFDCILGQDRPIGVLKSAVRSGRVHHAYLFTGEDGVGKRKTAMAFAQALVCLDEPARAKGEACGACRACTKVQASNHPDVTLIEPDRSKARDVLKISVIREVTRQVNYKPYEARNRVIVIDDVHTMTTEGSNAFLKTLEEPGGDTIFVLLTSQPRALLTTIRSRCQMLRFSPLAVEHVESLAISLGVAPDVAAIAASFSEGSLARAMTMAGEGVLEARKALLGDLARLGESDTRGGGALAVFNRAGELSRQSSDSLVVLLDFVKVFYRDVLLVQARVGEERLVNRDMKDAVVRAAARLSTDEAIGHIEHVAAVQRGLRSYVDTQLLMEDLLFALVGGAPGEA